jgi:hypothetical protein
MLNGPEKVLTPQGGTSAIDMRFALTVLAFALLIATSPIQNASANPVPIWDPPGSMPPVYLKEENITIEVSQGDAKVTATYIFALDGEGDRVVSGPYTLGLPFWGNHSNLKMELNGKGVTYSMGYFKYDSSVTNSTSMLACAFITVADFQLESVELKAVYDSDVKVLGSGSLKKYTCEYLVGSGKYWDRRIERSFFLFAVEAKDIEPVDDFGWSVDRKGNVTYFAQEHVDWVPSQDVISLTWTSTDPVAGDDDGIGTQTIIVIGLSISLVILIALAVWFTIQGMRKDRE